MLSGKRGKLGEEREEGREVVDLEGVKRTRRVRMRYEDKGGWMERKVEGIGMSRREKRAEVGF